MLTTRKLVIQAERALYRLWVATYGDKIEGADLWAALGFRSRRAFNDAAQHRRLTVDLHRSPTGLVRYAWTRDVFRTLWKEIERRRSKGGAT